MKKQIELWCLCVFLAVLIVLPHSAFGKRRPLLNLIEAPEGEGRRYVAAEEGQFFRTSVLYIRQGQGRKDTTEIWLVEVPDETSYVHGYMSTRNVNVIVEAGVTFDSTRKDYQYHYTLHNLEGSPQGAGPFEVAFDPSLPFSDFTAPQTKPNPWWAWGRQKEIDPEYWERAGRSLRWWGTLRLGESLGGFSFRSPVLPGIVHCWSSWYIPDVRGYLLGGNTLGPVALPDPLDPQKFVERLNAIVDESLSEGWIEDKKVAHDLKRKLESAREAVESGDKERLESVLRAVLRKVEEEKDGSLLSEAYALLKYNVRYWLDQLE